MNRNIDPRLASHPMFSESDLRYMRGKGYDDDEIIRFWDRDAAEGKQPVRHAEYEIERLLVQLLGFSLNAIDKQAAKERGVQGIDPDHLQHLLGIGEVRAFDGRDAGLVIEFEDGVTYHMPIERMFDQQR